MKLPEVNEPQRFEGLYVFDFGEWTAVGYTAREIAVLLEDEKHREGKVYRIHRVQPDGQMELAGVSAERFGLESGMFFLRNDEDQADADFDALTGMAEAQNPPARAYVQLADRGEEIEYGRYVLALIYPAEAEHDVSRWLLAVDFQGGDTVEGGISHVTNYYDQPKTILRRQQLWSADATPSRSAEEVLANVKLAVQR